tara:strand:- start:3 stop:251 length:249 start_codon:yes stop_codon:yes gene_type:complete
MGLFGGNSAKDAERAAEKARRRQETKLKKEREQAVRNEVFLGTEGVGHSRVADISLGAQDEEDELDEFDMLFTQGISPKALL